MQGINKQTELVLRTLSESDLIKDYTLIGGTALSIEINSRISEDLDFCIWQDRIEGKLYEIKWSDIETFLRSKFESVRMDLLDLQQVNYIADGVKLTFFVRQDVNSKHMHTQNLINNIKSSDVKSVGAMKLELQSRRNLFRDYYDIYAILREGYRFTHLIDLAIEYSGNKLKLKTILSILSNPEKFIKDENFKLLNPKYDVTSSEIRDFIIEKYKEETS